MSDACDPIVVPDVVLGGSVLLKAGPFVDAAGAAINLTAGWTLTLHFATPSDERTSLGTPAGSVDGYMTYTTQADELDEEDVWQARFKGVNGSTTRFSDLLRFRVVAVV